MKHPNTAHHRSLHAAIDAMRAAQTEAMAELAKGNTPDGRKNLDDITGTLKTLRSIEADERSLIVRVLKRFHLLH